jgi:hypothetical protein
MKRTKPAGALVAALALAACSSATRPPPAPLPASSEPVQVATSDEPGAPAPIVDQGTIRSRFRDCGNGFVGQVLAAPGVRCTDVCTTYGYSRCRGRAGQANLNACESKQNVVGTCDEAFEAGWTSQCDCTNAPK